MAAEGCSDGARYLLLGEVDHVQALNRRLGLNLPLQPYSGPEQQGWIAAVEPAGRRPAGGSSRRFARCRPGRRSLVARQGRSRCLRGELKALVTAPVNKEAIVRSGLAFVGQTEFLSQLAGTEKTAMMLLGQDERGRWLRVALATTHLPLKEVAARLTQPKIELAIELAARACRDLGLSRARVAVCGLNPHAGEGGKMGTEEQTIIAPAVRRPNAEDSRSSVR